MGKLKRKVLVKSFFVVFFSTCGSPSIISTLLPSGFTCDAGEILACLFHSSVLWNVGEKAFLFLVTLAYTQYSYIKISSQLHGGAPFRTPPAQAPINPNIPSYHNLPAYPSIPSNQSYNYDPSQFINPIVSHPTSIIIISLASNPLVSNPSIHQS